MGSAKNNAMKIRINSVIPNVLIMYSLLNGGISHYGASRYGITASSFMLRPAKFAGCFKNRHVAYSIVGIGSSGKDSRETCQRDPASGLVPVPYHSTPNSKPDAMAR